MIKFLLILTISLNVFSVPFQNAHRAGFLGNTSSRRGDIAGTIFFPSVLSLDANNSTYLYGGTKANFTQVKGGKNINYDQQRVDFVPYYTASVFSFENWKLSTFFNFTGDLNISASVDEPTLMQRFDVHSEQRSSKLGLSFSRKLYEKFSVGLSVFLELEERYTQFISTKKTSLQYLAFSQSEEKNLNLNANLSFSYTDQGVYSLGFILPQLKVDEKNKLEAVDFLEGDGLTESSEKYNYSGNKSFGLAFGFSGEKLSILTPSVDIILMNEYEGVSSFENIEYEFGYSYSLAFGLDFDLFEKTNLLLGYNYFSGDENKTVNETDSLTNTFSLGFELKSFKSRPIVGFNYIHYNGTQTKLLSLSFSSTYEVRWFI